MIQVVFMKRKAIYGCSIEGFDCVQVAQMFTEHHAWKPLNKAAFLESLVQTWNVAQLLVLCGIFPRPHLLKWLGSTWQLPTQKVNVEFLFNRFACFRLKGYQRGSLWKSHQKATTLKQAMRKSPPTGFEPAAAFGLPIHCSTT